LGVISSKKRTKSHIGGRAGRDAPTACKTVAATGRENKPDDAAPASATRRCVIHTLFETARQSRSGPLCSILCFMKNIGDGFEKRRRALWPSYFEPF
jgi:hypothetical protein